MWKFDRTLDYRPKEISDTPERSRFLLGRTHELQPRAHRGEHLSYLPERQMKHPALHDGYGGGGATPGSQDGRHSCHTRTFKIRLRFRMPEKAELKGLLPELLF